MVQWSYVLYFIFVWFSEVFRTIARPVTRFSSYFAHDTVNVYRYRIYACEPYITNDFYRIQTF